MNVLLLCIVFIGFYLLINTSNKAVLRSGILEKWMQKNNKKAKILGIFCFLVTIGVAVFLKGISGGILFLIIAISLIASLVVIFNPLQNINYKYILLLVVFLLILELIFI